MAHLALSDFLDVISKAGSPKATAVRKIKHRGPYSPAKDFYKPLRDGIVDAHESNKSPATLSAVLLKVAAAKHANYSTVIAGYRKWWGKRPLTWFEPPSGNYIGSGFDIGVNPELGLKDGSANLVIKLHLKDEPLTKFRTDLITALMAETLGAGVSLGVLDVRRSKLFLASGSGNSMMPMVNAELAYIAALWPNV
jgi:hypothetical protein